MNASPEKTEPTLEAIRPPQLIQSLVGGFNAVANNISLILLPAALDFLLWFGPHVRVKKLLEPGATEMLNFMRSRGAPESRAMLDGLGTVIEMFLERYNLLSTLNTFPVGLPSRMAALGPIATPTGTPPGVEVGSFVQFILGWLLLLLAGFVLGSIYFALVARTCEQTGRKDPSTAADLATGGMPSINITNLTWQIMQVIGLVIILVGILLVLLAPTLVISLLVGLLSPILAQFAMLLMGFATVWLLVPLVFSPHGIFLRGQSVFNSMLTSTRVVRLSLPATGLFLLTLIVLNQGLGVLWSSPPETSWLAAVGIFGHAFINTAILAAMFFYYRGGLNYLQSLRREAVQRV